MYKVIKFRLFPHEGGTVVLSVHLRDGSGAYRVRMGSFDRSEVRHQISYLAEHGDWDLSNKPASSPGHGEDPF